MRAESSPGLENGKFVVRKLVKYIKENNLQNGQSLPNIPKLADLLGTGRNVVRDGLMQAQNLGIVEIRPRSGTFVRTPGLSPLVDALTETVDMILMSDKNNLMQLVEARCVLEAGVIAKAAAERKLEDMLVLREHLEKMRTLHGKRPEYIATDEQFHLGIAALTGNRVLESFLKSLLDILRPYRYSFLTSKRIMGGIDGEHEDIYMSLIDADPGRAVYCLRKHLDVQKEMLIKSVMNIKPGRRGKGDSAEAGKQKTQRASKGPRSSIVQPGKTR